MDNVRTILLSESDLEHRIDVAIASLCPDLSRQKVKNLIISGAVYFNGEPVKKPDEKVKECGEVVIDISQILEETESKAENIPLDIIYEDQYFLAINKAPGVAVHPGAGLKSGTIVNALLWRFANFAERFDDKLRPGIVHRLDKDTSGALLVAKNQEVKEKLQEFFAERKIVKKYLGITYGVPKELKGVIETGFGRHPTKRYKMSVIGDSERRASTEYRVVKEFLINGERCALLELKINTGRTHQIRVHLAHIKSPILGDKIYGGRQKIECIRQMLHARSLRFSHPYTGKEICLKASLTEDFLCLLKEQFSDLDSI